MKTAAHSLSLPGYRQPHSLADTYRQPHSLADGVTYRQDHSLADTFRQP